MTRVVRHVGLTLFALELALLSTRARADMDPNPLESAYWRFEEGPNSSNVNFLLADPILDSMNQNHLDTFNADTSPVYTTNVPPTALRSGLPNTLALDFIPHDGGGDDLFTLFGDGALGKGFAKNINNGMIEPGEGFTIEAAFNTNNPARFAAIIATKQNLGIKESGPLAEENNVWNTRISPYVLCYYQPVELIQADLSRIEVYVPQMEAADCP